MQHLNVVEAVPECDGLRGRETGSLQDPLAARPFVDAARHDVDAGRVPAYQFKIGETIKYFRHHDLVQTFVEEQPGLMDRTA